MLEVADVPHVAISVLAAHAEDSGLIGREAELGAIWSSLAEPAAEGRPTIVLTGPPGIGKTAAIDAIRSYATGAGVDVTSLALEGRGGLPMYRPSIEIADRPAHDPALRARLVSRLRLLRACGAGTILAVDDGDDLLACLQPCERTIVAFAPLGETQMRAIIARWGGLGERSIRIARIACGNPRHARELLTAARPSSVETELERLRASDDGALRIAAACAIGTDERGEIDLDLVCHLTRTKRAVIGAVLTAMAKHRLVVATRFHDELTRATVERRVPATARKRLHARAGTIVAAAFGSNERLVHHFCGAGDMARACEYQLAIANAHLSRQEFDSALRAYDAALANGSLALELEAKAHADRSFALENLQRFDEAIGASERAIAGYRLLRRTHLVDAEIVRAAYLAMTASPRPVLDRLLDRRGDDAAGTAAADAELLLFHCSRAATDGRVDEARAQLRALWSAFDHVEPQVRARMYEMRALVATLCPSESTTDTVLADFVAALKCADGIGAVRLSAYVRVNFASALVERGDLARARCELERALSDALGLHDPTLLAYVRVETALVALLGGEIAKAAHMLEASHFANAPFDARAKRLWPLFRLSVLTDDRTLISLADAEELLEEARLLGSVERTLTCESVVALFHAREGNVARARMLANAILREVSHVHIDYDLLPFVASLADGEVRSGILTLYDTAARVFHPDYLAVLRATCALPCFGSVRPGPHDRAAYHDVIARAEGLGLFGLALHFVRLIGPTSGIARLERALGLDTSTVRPFPSRFALTQRERTIASLVARRKRNVEIATELHLSVSTVEKHVSAILAKLGVASRYDIERVVAGTVAGSVN